MNGSLRLPGDKSISHRYALLAAFAKGITRISNFSTGADCASSLACAQALGAHVDRRDEDTIAISGTAGRFAASESPLDCGNSGSTIRMLSGLLAAQARQLHAGRRCLAEPPADGAHSKAAHRQWAPRSR